MPQIEVDSQHVQYKDDVIISDYKYQTSSVICHDNKVTLNILNRIFSILSEGLTST